MQLKYICKHVGDVSKEFVTIPGTYQICHFQNHLL